MDKLRQKIQNFMYGRNGMDDLGKMLFIVFVVMYVLSVILNNQLLYLISFMGLVYVLSRVFSKKVNERVQENQKYLSFVKLNKMRWEQRKEYRIFKCKGCGRNVRVPKGKGKIEITCPSCGRKEIHRT